jgi:alkylhydroperoxidase family enzyme
VTRVPSTGSLRELGVINWAFCKLAARRIRVPQVQLFTTLGTHKPLLWTWLPFAGYLLYIGKLSRKDAEFVILRVAHLRGSQYELQQHRRLARSRGIDEALQDKIFEGPDAEGLTDRQRTLLIATDELINTRNLSDPTWVKLSRYLDRPQLIEFVTLAGQYDALAATLNTLKVPLDLPE